MEGVYKGQALWGLTFHCIPCREAIGLVCEAVPGAKGAVRRRKPCSRSLNSILGKSNLKFAGMPITLTISTSSLNLMASDCKQCSPAAPASLLLSHPQDTAEYVAYVAKDPVNQRACHILECPEGLAQDVISTIGQAFELRFKQMAGFDGSAWDEEEEEPAPDHQYYNDFPGKEPPIGGVVDMRLQDGAAQTPNHLGATLVVASMEEQLRREPWYHGKMSRKEAEKLLKVNGDFLVRESTTTPGQYVLTGLQGGQPKHLLLVDPEGVVRTKDHRFESVSHLISYHMDNHLPIISAGSEMCLQQPVERRL
ncbi:hypothetical protein EK904_008622 [Melospiza melodia maxima]|nr:hypothetical protein EK904_008622 [Melospiza melodia maxima]